MFIFIKASLIALTVVLPISTVTPGALNPSVTQANIRTTICKSGYTGTIRPSAGYTTRLKQIQLATTYASYANKSLAAYEEDHLISLELGGSPTDPKNLWPEPYAGATGAHLKDLVENRLHALVCVNKITLAAAQKLIATNWYSAYQLYLAKK